MNAPTRVAGFVAGLAAIFGVALAIGTQFGPIARPAEAQDAGRDHAHASDERASNSDLPGGLMTSDRGYTLVLQAATSVAGSAQPISFVIKGPDGLPVTDFDIVHGKQLHLIVVRRDFSGFQHLHPQLASDGTWTTVGDLAPGQWRVFADFKPAGGDGLTLGADLAVPGDVEMADLPAVQRTSRIGNYTVALTGDLHTAEHSMLTLTVEEDGQPVSDLDPYLGAYGHLVALREGDLAYLHVHPSGEPGDGETEAGPTIDFGVEVPSAGTYHLYLDFSHQGVVRTAQFALKAPSATASADEGGSDEHSSH